MGRGTNTERAGWIDKGEKKNNRNELHPILKLFKTQATSEKN